MYRLKWTFHLSNYHTDIMLGTAVNANAVVSAVGTIVSNDAVVIVAPAVIGVAVATLTASLSVVATTVYSVAAISC